VDGVRVGNPAVSFPSDVVGNEIHNYLFPDLIALVALVEEFAEPIYLRHPDAVATVDR